MEGYVDIDCRNEEVAEDYFNDMRYDELASEVQSVEIERSEIAEDYGDD
jgi:hypothetical protein